MANEFDAVLLRLYGLSREKSMEDFQDAALSLIKPFIPFDSAMWGTATATSDGIDIHSIHLHEKSPEMLLAYGEVKHLDRAAQAVLSAPRATVGVNASEWFSSSEDRELREFLSRFEHENIFITADTNLKTNFVHWVSLFRADPDRHCSESERRLLARLAPHLMQSLAFNRIGYLDSVARKQGPAQFGSAIADPRGVLYHVDPRFLELAQVEWDDWNDTRLPEKFVADVLRCGGFAGRTLMVSGHVEQKLLFLRARARCPADMLTAREHAIAKFVAQGKTYKEIAQALGRSPSTVRNQLQVIYDKLNVNGIAGLIAELQRGA